MMRRVRRASAIACGNARQRGAGQHEVGRALRQRRAVADRDRDVGAGQHRRIVEAVADHRHDAALLPAARARRPAWLPASAAPARRRCPALRRSARTASRGIAAATGATSRPCARSAATAARAHRRASLRARRSARPRAGRRRARARRRRAPPAAKPALAEAPAAPVDHAFDAAAGHRVRRRRAATSAASGMGERARRADAGCRAPARPRCAAPASQSMPSNVARVCQRGLAVAERAGLVEHDVGRRAPGVSSASARSASTPSRASAPCAAASAAGTASDSAHGQLITSSASVTSNARAGSCGPPRGEHDGRGAPAGRARSTPRRGRPAAPAAADAPARCSTSRASCDRRVPLPVAVTRRRAGRSRQSVPANTASPARLAHRRGLAGEQRFLEARARRRAARRRRARSRRRRRRRCRRRASVATGTISRVPSPRSRVANAGRARASASTCARGDAARALFEHARGQQQEHEHHRRVVPDVRAAAQGLDHAGEVGEQRRSRDQRVHAEAALAQLARSAGEERPAGVEHHRCRHQEGDPAEEVARRQRHLAR